MLRTISRLSTGPVAAGLAVLLLTGGCGDVQVTTKDSKSTKAAPTASPSNAVDTSPGQGNWLLGMSSAGGADGETSTTVYITFNPATGQGNAKRLPGVQGASAGPEQAALLVSADRLWAIPDTEISRSEEKGGQLKVYSLSGSGTKVLDIRALTGKDDVEASGWAFDPERADTLRVVDTKKRVWAVSVAGGKATQESSLAKGPWIFANGFNRNTGLPWVESITNDETLPAGNGPADTTPVRRDGGTVLPSGSPGLAKLPASPCRLGAGFTDRTGVTWAFCADGPTIPAYYLPKDGKDWTAFGKASPAVAPTAAVFPLVLPPAE